MFKAVSFRHSCGATTGFSTHVSVLPSAERLSNKAGNVLIIGDERNLHMHWSDDQQLRISGVGSAAMFKQEGVLQGIKITYE